MQIQKSFQDDGQGILYIVPTPIGNLDDITLRALDTLKKVQLILAEDTRHTQKLLNHFDITNQLLSYHEHNMRERTDQIIKRLQAGEELALVSDAGMPAISDPGYDLVKAAIASDIRVIVLPGANAALGALIGSGLPTDEFIFYGFLSRKRQEKATVLQRLAQYQATIILYESPHRVKDTMQMIAKTLGNRGVVIAREITKIHEEFIRGQAEEVAVQINDQSIKGECCIVIEGRQETVQTAPSWWVNLSIKEHVLHYESEGTTHKAALKKVAVDRNMSRRDIYRELHIKSKND